MKSIKKLLFVAVSFYSLFSFFGCQDVIFYNIKKEVSLNGGTVAGSIRYITRHTAADGKEYMYLSNGAKILRKENTGVTSDHTYGGWETVCSSEGLGILIKVVADSSYLYAFVGEWYENVDKGQNRLYKRSIYCSADDGKNWTLVKSIQTVDSDYYHGNTTFYLFCTNSIKKENRKAFFNDNGDIYELNGTTTPTPFTKLTDAEKDALPEEYKSTGTAQTKPTKDTKSCASLNGTVYFFNGYDACTNETTAGGDETVLYYTEGSSVGWRDSTTTFHGSVSAVSVGMSIATTKDTVLLGSFAGIQHFDIRPDKSIGGEIEFPNNAQAIMSRSYEVPTLLVVNPESNESETAIYSAMDFEGRSQQYEHRCLWSYYPSRGNWNRD